MNAARHRPRSHAKKRSRIGRWLLVVLGFLVLAGIAVAVLFDWNWLRHPAQRLLTAQTGRETRIEGRLEGQWSLRPRFIVERFHMANAEWAGEKELASIERAEVVVDLPELLRGRMVLPEIRLAKPNIALQRRADGQTNWTFGAEAATEIAAPEERTEVPLIGLLVIEDGRLAYKDEKAGLNIDAKVSTAVGAGGEGEGEVEVKGQGDLHGERFDFSLRGGSLLSLREADAPYPLTIEMVAGPTRGRISGTLQDPIRFEGLDLEASLAGPNLGRLQVLTGVPLPMTKPYDLTGRLERDGSSWRITDMTGRIGSSDLAGRIHIETGREKLYLEADLHSKVLDYRDVGPLIGLRPEQGQPSTGPANLAADRGQPPPSAEKERVAPPRVLPDAPLAIEQIRNTDARLKFRGEQVQAPNTPLSGVDLDLALQDSQLRLQPLRLGVAGGFVNADIVIDARQDVVVTDYDVRLNRFELNRFVTAAGLKDAATGQLHGRIRLAGYGDTVQKSLGSANGDMRLTMDGGSLSNLALELVGLDAAETARFLAGGDRRIPLRCFVADYKVEDGVMMPRVFVFDTTDTTLTSEGQINLKDERLDLRLLAHPKDPSPLSSRSPITVRGAFSRLEVGVEAGPLAARAAGAVVLGVLLTPLASILAFIEPGLERDSDCVALLQENRTQQ